MYPEISSGTKTIEKEIHEQKARKLRDYFVLHCSFKGYQIT